MDPDLDIWQAFPLESADLEGDLAEVADDWAVDELRQKAGEAMRGRLQLSDLDDDVGTTYVPGGFSRRTHWGLGEGASEGHNEFRPTPPAGAHKLKWTWLNTTVEIPLR